MAGQGSANPERKAFAGTTGIGSLDNISLYHLFEDESRDWVARHGGAVVELHAYGVDPAVTEAELRADLLARDGKFLSGAQPARRILEDRFLMRGDCPSFAPGSDAVRPTVVETAHPGIALAGDFVRLPFPTALMERAVASGFLAANQLLAAQGIAPEPIHTVPLRGLFGRRPSLKSA